MLVTVTGGSGSGKSEYSENLLLSLDGKHHGGRAYIATMYPYDKESFKRIDRHREMRKNKGFTTVECYTGLKQLMLPKGCRSALLECMSNLAANECFMENGAGADTVPEIFAGVRHLYKQLDNLVIVTNEISSDGTLYERETRNYQKILGDINRGLAGLSDGFVEVVYGIPVIHKAFNEQGGTQ